MKRYAAIALTFLAVACSTTKPQPPQVNETMRGTASWYGQEYAGRTTANGEIFDPMQLTAAHRTLPFGTVVDVKNLKNGQTVRVRVNDRGPYINDRLIDLSYAAARKIGLIEPGSGDVEVAIVRVGKGDREPPAPYIVSVPEVKPLPESSSVEDVPVMVTAPPVAEPAETRRQVSPDGKTIQTIPVKPAPAPVQPKQTAAASASTTRGNYIVQVGAFAVEANAKLLVDQLAELGETAHVDHTNLFHVRIGPFATREEAVRTRTRLENEGLSAIVITP